MDDRYDLQRFVIAQQPIYAQVIRELSQGRKMSHWMWFIFPQIAGLGQSAMSQMFAISSRDEAVAFLAHPLLGPRLRECTLTANRIDAKSARQVFGHPDDLKFHSSMTLFAVVALDEALFGDALRKYFGGEPDNATLERL